MAESNESKFSADTNVIDFAERVSKGEIVEAEVPEGTEMTEWTFSNDKTNHAIRQLFHMLHQSVFVNKLGVMHAKRKDSDLIETLIVGVEVLENGSIATWPIAKLLTEEEQEQYLAPDGSGGYIE